LPFSLQLFHRKTLDAGLDGKI